MSRLTIRHLRDSELKTAGRLVIDSINALFKKNNIDPIRIRVTGPSPFMLHLKHTDPDGCLGAFEGDRMVGFVSSIIRENQWYLAFLFIAPGRWGKGIGKKLLVRALKTADLTETNLFSLCTFSYNPQAVALYSSFGMTPYEAILNMKWQHKNRVKLRVKRPGRKLSIEIVEDYEKLAFINRLDRENRGLARPEDHKFFIDNDKTDLIHFLDKGKPVGYAVLYKKGIIAPVSTVDPVYLPDMLSACIRYQLDAACEEITVGCAGSNGDIIRYLLGVGFRVNEIALLVSNKRFGNLNQYLPAHLAIF